MGGSFPCNLANSISSRTSALPTEKIVPKVSLLDDFLNATDGEYVFGKEATGKPLTRSSSFLSVSVGTEGMLSVSLGDLNACTVYTGVAAGG